MNAEVKRRIQEASLQRRRLFANKDRAVAAVLNLSFLYRHEQAGQPQPGESRLAPIKLDRPSSLHGTFAAALSFLENRRRRADLLRSRLFDRQWYLEQNPDVVASGTDPLGHFLEHGVYEGRAPGPDFDASAYLARYPDVLSGGLEPWRHFFLHGKAEGRIAEAMPKDAAQSQRTVLRFRPLSARPNPRTTQHVDGLDANGLRGWAFDSEQPERPVEISLYIDEVLVAHTYADEFRSDLAEIGLGNGCFGFDVPIPKRAYFQGKVAAVYARIGGGDVLIGHWETNKPIECAPRRQQTVHLDISDLLHYLSTQRRPSGIQRVQIGLLLGLLNAPRAGYDVNVCARRSATRFNDVHVEMLCAFLSKVARSEAEWAADLQALHASSSKLTTFCVDDCLLLLGAPWAVENHAHAVRSLKTLGVRFCQVLYDVVPVAMPQVVDTEVVPVFSESLATLFVYADYLFAISEYSRTELLSLSRFVGNDPIAGHVIPLGSILPERSDPEPHDIEELLQWKIDGDFVLCVGTIEPRKNHALLYIVWERLLKESKAPVPKLVLVGRIGWHMESFVRALEASDFLEQHVVIIPEASDKLLNSLYHSCLFTVFPSLYEGWGLPIVESFGYGKACVCSSTTSMPEAGQDLAVYIDPYNATGAFETLRDLIANRDRVRSLENKIRNQFVPVSWPRAAEKFIAILSSFLSDGSQPGAGRGLEVLESDRRYVLQAIIGQQSARKRLLSDIASMRLNRILDGPSWFDIEGDRCWACGSSAKLRFACDLSVDGVLVEFCLPGGLSDRRCSVRVDGVFRGKILPASDYGVMHVVFPRGGRLGERFIELSLCAPAMEQSKPDKRLLGPGIMSIYLYSGSLADAMTRFLSAEVWSRNKDLGDLKSHILEVGQIEIADVGANPSWST